MLKPKNAREYQRALAAQSADLIAELDRLFPAAHPRLSDTDREIWFNAGRRAVVDLLLQLKAEANDRSNILET